MTQKNLIGHDELNLAHIYISNCVKQQTQRRLIDDLLENAFAGSPVKLANTLFP